MLVLAAMTTLCTGAVAFYVRFMVALWRDSKPRWVAYWVRLRGSSMAETETESKEENYHFTRAA